MDPPDTTLDLKELQLDAIASGRAKTRYGSRLHSPEVAAAPIRYAADVLARIKLKDVDDAELAATVVVCDALLTFTGSFDPALVGGASIRANAVFSATLVRAAGFADGRRGVADMSSLPPLGDEEVAATKIEHADGGIWDPDRLVDTDEIWDAAGYYAAWLRRLVGDHRLADAVEFVVFDLTCAGTNGWYGQLAAAVRMASATP